jgi:hypothetical protein
LTRPTALIESLENRRLMSAAAAVVYQAEAATLTGGTTADDNWPGYTGTGFANLPLTGGAVTFAVPETTAGVYRLTFRYALSPAASRTVALSVDGTALPGGFTFTTTGAWSTWGTKAVLVNLAAGANTVRVASTGQDSGNIDSMTVSPALSGTVSFTTLDASAYAAGDVNSCAISVNNLFTDPKTGLQFAALYDTSGDIVLARRAAGAATWQTYATGLSDPVADISDDHDVIAIETDGAGYLHVSWGMHNIPLDYAVSTAPVTTASLASVAFTKLSAATAPTLFPGGGATTNEVTYPQFYRIPGSGDLLFTYRNGGAGGGSGNGDQYVDRYTIATRTWTNTLVINGEATSVNAYVNRLAFTPSGTLVMTWTWRATPNWQTNSDLCYAQSPDDGVTWYHQGGTVRYALPIVQTGAAASLAQVVRSFPQGSSWINQTSETTDAAGNPIVATFDTPNYNPATGTGNVNRQYVLSYYDGSAWQTTQVSDRTSDTAIDTSGADVRDLGRPIVLVDAEGRVLVVTRSEDTAMGAYANPATPNNDIVVYYTSKLAAAATVWHSVTIDAADMGAWEPTYDSALWASANQLDLFYEPVGLTGESTSAVKVLAWNESAFFSGT